MCWDLSHYFTYLSPVLIGISSFYTENQPKYPTGYTRITPDLVKWISTICPFICPIPSVSVEPPDQTIAQGDRAVMRCVGGRPGDQVTWQKVGEDLSASVIVTEDKITIR